MAFRFRSSSTTKACPPRCGPWSWLRLPVKYCASTASGSAASNEFAPWLRTLISAESDPIPGLQSGSEFRRSFLSWAYRKRANRYNQLRLVFGSPGGGEINQRRSAVHVPRYRDESPVPSSRGYSPHLARAFLFFFPSLPERNASCAHGYWCC